MGWPVIGLLAAVAVAQPADVTVEPPDLPAGSLRTRAMGGAMVAVAEGASSVPGNPAAMAVRRSHLAVERHEADLSLQLAAHPWITAAQELLRGGPVPLPRARARWRVGLDGRAERIGAALAVGEESWDGDDGRWVTRRFAAGVGVSGGTWAVGASPSLVQFRGDDDGSVGADATIGGLWAPLGRPYRLGARVRTPLRTGALADGRRLRLPYEVGVGGSATIGATNAASAYGPDREADGDWWLVDVDLVATGSGGDAVALLPLLDGERSAVGGPTLAVRAGVEWATWHDGLRLRAGIATVPGRGGTTGARVGFGAGVELFEALGLSYRLAGYVGIGPEGLTAGLGGETW